MVHFTSVYLLLARLLWLCSGGKGVPASKQLLGSPPVFSNCELGELSKTNLHKTPKILPFPGPRLQHAFAYRERLQDT